MLPVPRLKGAVEWVWDATVQFEYHDHYTAPINYSCHKADRQRHKPHSKHSSLRPLLPPQRQKLCDTHPRTHACMHTPMHNNAPLVLKTPHQNPTTKPHHQKNSLTANRRGTPHQTSPHQSPPSAAAGWCPSPKASHCRHCQHHQQCKTAA